MPRTPVGVIVGSNRRESINRRLALALTRLVEDRIAWRWIRIDDLPMYNQDLEARPARDGTALHRRSRERSGRAVRHAGAQPLAPRRAQERDRLGVEAKRISRCGGAG